MQKFVEFDLRRQRKGTTVEVTLSAQAYVRLMDSQNYALYKTGKKYEFYGGLVKVTPHRLAIPYDGIWHIAVDTGKEVFPYPIEAKIRMVQE